MGQACRTGRQYMLLLKPGVTGRQDMQAVMVDETGRQFMMLLKAGVAGRQDRQAGKTDR